MPVPFGEADPLGFVRESSPPDKTSVGSLSSETLDVGPGAVPTAGIKDSSSGVKHRAIDL